MQRRAYCWHNGRAVVILSIDFVRGAIYLIMSVYVRFNASLMVFPDSLMIMRTPLDFVQDTAGCLLMSQFKQNSGENWMSSWSKNETSTAEAEIVLSHVISFPIIKIS